MAISSGNVLSASDINSFASTLRNVLFKYCKRSTKRIMYVYTKGGDGMNMHYSGQMRSNGYSNDGFTGLAYNYDDGGSFDTAGYDSSTTRSTIWNNILYGGHANQYVLRATAGLSGATLLRVTVTYQTENNADCDWGCIWSGTQNVSANNYSTSFTGRLYGPTKTQKMYIVPSDRITVCWNADYSVCFGYGMHIKIEDISNYKTYYDNYVSAFGISNANNVIKATHVNSLISAINTCIGISANRRNSYYTGSTISSASTNGKPSATMKTVADAINNDYCSTNQGCYCNNDCCNTHTCYDYAISSSGTPCCDSNCCDWDCGCDCNNCCDYVCSADCCNRDCCNSNNKTQSCCNAERTIKCNQCCNYNRKQVYDACCGDWTYINCGDYTTTYTNCCNSNAKAVSCCNSDYGSHCNVNAGCCDDNCSCDIDSCCDTDCQCDGDGYCPSNKTNCNCNVDTLVFNNCSPDRDKPNPTVIIV